MPRRIPRILPSLLLLLATGVAGYALDPRKSLTQYSRSGWTQSLGLPQNSIRAMAQTTDGYLWIGTREGIARFDGYQFTAFNQEHGNLPSNTIYALAPAPQGGLWIGTPEGLTEYRGGKFHTFTKKDGLPDNLILFLHTSRSGALWLVGEGAVCRFESGKFTTWRVGIDLPMTSVREFSEDAQGHLFLAGDNAVTRYSDGKFVPELDPAILRGLNAVLSSGVLIDRAGALWVLTTRGLLQRAPGSSSVRMLGPAEGLSPQFNNSRGDVMEDRDGNIWVGTSGGLGRVEKGRLKFLADPPARLLLEDREGNIWTGSDNGLTQFRDDVFTVYGRTEGLPSDQPSVIHQDRRGRTWVGFFDTGLFQLQAGEPRTLASGATASNIGALRERIYSIRETRSGDLLVGVSRGLVRINDNGSGLFTPPDPSAREWVNDAIEDTAGRTWVGYSGGLAELAGDRFRTVISRDQARSPVVTLAVTTDGALWAGTYDKGLWRIFNGETKLFTAADGLGSDQIRVLHPDAAGSLWIGTIDGGLAEFQAGLFSRYTVKNGLASDNISAIADDGENLWLSTTRGITRVSRATLRTGKGPPAITFGLGDGLRSAEGLQSVASGGNRHADGSLWFATPRGIAVYGINPPRVQGSTPEVHIESLLADGQAVNWVTAPRIAPGAGNVAIQFSAIHLRAPDHLRFSWQLQGLDDTWTDAGSRHTADFHNLAPGAYRFTVKAELPDGAFSTASAGFELLPRYYQTVWFRGLLVLAAAALIWSAYRYRERQVKAGYALVIEERARLAREVHDTLAQGFVGIASQLDVVDMCLPPQTPAARGAVDLARKMARHSLTEARRSVMDLRTGNADRPGLAEALRSGAPLWSAGSGVPVEVEISGDTARLSEKTAHHILRIAQEGVANAIKHSRASHVLLTLAVSVDTLNLQVTDDGQGFQPENTFIASKGHFGLLGMRERAQALGGELRVESEPGKGTRLLVSAPVGKPPSV